MCLHPMDMRRHGMEAIMQSFIPGTGPRRLTLLLIFNDIMIIQIKTIL